MQTPFSDYDLDDDINRIDWSRVHAWLASSYWCPGISLARVKRAAENSAFVLGAYQQNVQAGFLRVISDKTRFAYLCDVWIDQPHRAKGLARAMVRYAMDHPDFESVAWLLATKDAHGVSGLLISWKLIGPDRFENEAQVGAGIGGF
jgi:ribosomal protein S18 acetylase RimI-like enzyme